MVAARGPGTQEDMGPHLFTVLQAHRTLGGPLVRLHQGLGYSGFLGGVCVCVVGSLLHRNAKNQTKIITTH